jgi:hypothetical protein
MCRDSELGPCLAWVRRTQKASGKERQIRCPFHLDVQFLRIPMCHHHPLLSFRSTSIFKAAQERGKRRREGWKGTDGAALVSLSGPLEVRMEGEHEKRKCCLTLNGAGNLQLGR